MNRIAELLQFHLLATQGSGGCLPNFFASSGEIILKTLLDS